MAKGKITLQMLSEMMANNSGRSKSATEAFVRTFFTVLKDALQRDNLVKIRGFGTFKLVVVNPRESVNVNNGERVSIAGYNKITFTPDKSLKDRINRPFAQFDTMVIDDEDVALIEGGEVVETPAETTETPAETAETPAEIVETHAPVVEEQPAVAEPEPEPAPIAAAIAQPAEQEVEPAKEEPVPAEPTPEPAKEESAPAEPEVEPAPKPKKRGWLWVLVALVVVLIAVGAFLLGRYNTGNASAAEVADTTAVSDEAKLSPEEQAALDSIAQLRAAAANYEQVEGGELLIAGLKTCRKMQAGMTLERYCRRIYGDKAMLPYVMKFNNFQSEYVPVGKVINFPILVEKQ